MNQRDLVTLLESFSFKSLTLISSSGNTHTYKFKDVEPRLVSKHLGSPKVAANGKVAIYEVPGVGRIGLSPSNQVVRLILADRPDLPTANDAHLGQRTTTEELTLAYKRAQGNPKFQLQFATQLWLYFNEHKFGGRLSQPKLVVSPKPPFPVKGLRNPRGIYQGSPNFGVGTIWLADFLFNAREAFFNEILLHEMCHQAVWFLDHYRSTSAADAHGPVWAKWMKHVGLDPRRFDPTDSLEYQDTGSKIEEEVKRERMLGPRASKQELDKLVPLPALKFGPALMLEKGRILRGAITANGRKLVFMCTEGPAKGWSWEFKTTPDLSKFFVDEK